MERLVAVSAVISAENDASTSDKPKAPALISKGALVLTKVLKTALALAEEMAFETATVEGGVVELKVGEGEVTFPSRPQYLSRSPAIDVMETAGDTHGEAGASLQAASLTLRRRLDQHARALAKANSPQHLVGTSRH